MNDTSPRILVIEDEPQIRRFVCEAVGKAGCRTIEACTARQGLDTLVAEDVALAILDLGLPDMNGIDFIRKLRRWSALPVLVLSARSDERDKIEALDVGADDYLTKPFGVGELQARIRALLRRHAAGAENGALHSFGDIEVDIARRQVRRGGESLHLTQIEFKLLIVLLNNAGKSMTNRHLMREVWGSGQEELPHYVRIYMRRLRQKLEHDPTRPQYLLTETGVGYRFQP